MVKIPRATKLKAVKHLNLEREALELVTRHRCPNITGLDYAFRYGDTWLVLAMPLMAGGVLQTHIEERAEGAGGFPLSEVRGPSDRVQLLLRHRAPAPSHLNFVPSQSRPISTSSHRPIPISSQVRWIGAQLILGLEALHRVGFVHRDIKPTNVVLRHDGHWFLTDLGLCARIEPPTTGRAGTRGYWAPETIERRPQAAANLWDVMVVSLLCVVDVLRMLRVLHHSRS